MAVTKINKILITIDGSPYAHMALMYVIGLAKDVGSKMNVIHVKTRDEIQLKRKRCIF